MMNDPLRQRMLFRTEWRSAGVEADTPSALGLRLNEAFAELLREGFSVSQVLPVSEPLEVGVGALILAQRVLPAGAEPTPDQVPLPGTNAQQTIEVVYNYVDKGVMGRKTFAALSDAVREAARDLEASGQGAGTRQPLGVHVSSVTAYGPGDVAALRDRYK